MFVNNQQKNQFTRVQKVTVRGKLSFLSMKCHLRGIVRDSDSIVRLRKSVTKHDKQS